MFKILVLWNTMALLCVEYHSVPVSFPLGEDNHAIVTGITLSLRFNFW